VYVTKSSPNVELGETLRFIAEMFVSSFVKLWLFLCVCKRDLWTFIDFESLMSSGSDLW